MRAKMARLATKSLLAPLNMARSPRSPLTGSTRTQLARATRISSRNPSALASQREPWPLPDWSEYSLIISSASSSSLSLAAVTMMPSCLMRRRRRCPLLLPGTERAGLLPATAVAAHGRRAPCADGDADLLPPVLPFLGRQARSVGWADWLAVWFSLFPLCLSGPCAAGWPMLASVAPRLD